jgi:hypothetical protein
VTALAVGVSPLHDLGGVLAWASPFTGVLALTAGPDNLRVTVDAAEWAAIGWVAGVGVVAWIVVAPWWGVGPGRGWAGGRDTGAPPPPGWGSVGSGAVGAGDAD